MTAITASALTMVDAEPDRVRAALADYVEVRPAILTAHFSRYQVLEGGTGAGSRVSWTVNPSRWFSWRARDWEVEVEEVAEEAGPALVERDTRSAYVLTWRVLAAPDGRSVVKLELTGEAPGGARRLFARSGTNRLGRLFGDVLLELHRRFQPESPDTVEA